MALPFEISVEDFAELRKNGPAPLLLDVREPDEYQTAQIDGSVLIPLAEVTTRAVGAFPDKSAHIVVHCHHGMRSARAAEYLLRVGYENVQNLAGGIDAWSAKIDSAVPVY